MQRIDYSARGFIEDAWLAVGSSDSIEITIPRNLAKRTEKALKAYVCYYKLRDEGGTSWKLLLKLTWYGFWVPVLWGVINHAELYGIRLRSWHYEQDLLIIKLAKASSGIQGQV